MKFNIFIILLTPALLYSYDYSNYLRDLFPGITTLLLLGFIIWIVKFLEKEIPRLVKRKRGEWKAELQRKKIIEEHEDKLDLEIKRVVKEEKKRIFEKKRK